MHSAFKKSNQLTRPLLFHQRSIANISFIRNTVRSQISQGSIYRGLGIVATVQLSATLFSTYMVDKTVTMSVQDYLENKFLKENQEFQIVGIIKPGSVQIQRGSLEIKFILTNFDDDIHVYYKGETKYEFKEGETLVLNAYVPDKNNRKKIMGIGYLTKHSMDGSIWADKQGVERKTYGLNSRMQAQMM